MKDTFDFSRFGQLLNDDLRVNGRRYAIFMGSLLGTLAVIIIWKALILVDYVGPWLTSVGKDPSWTFEVSIFWIGLFIMGCTAAAKLCDTLDTKEHRIARLTQPATQGEKFLSRWLVFIPGFLVCYIIGFELVDLLRVLVVHLRWPESTINMPIGMHIFTGNDDATDGSWMLLGVFVFLQSVCALGSTLWPGKAMLRTAAWSAAYCLVASVWTSLLFYVLIVRPALLEGKLLMGGHHDVSWALVVGLLVAGAVVNYVVAYYRTKELEIIDRW